MKPSEPTEAQLRLADVKAQLQRITYDDVEGFPQEDINGLLSAIEHAVDGTAGCLEVDEWDRERRRAWYQLQGNSCFTSGHIESAVAEQVKVGDITHLMQEGGFEICCFLGAGRSFILREADGEGKYEQPKATFELKWDHEPHRHVRAISVKLDPAEAS